MLQAPIPPSLSMSLHRSPSASKRVEGCMAATVVAAPHTPPAAQCAIPRTPVQDQRAQCVDCWFAQELSGAQKKKLKKKAKAKADKAGAGEEEAEAEAAEPAPAKKGAKKVAGGKAPSAAVRKLQEDLERRRVAEEAARQAEEERIRQVGGALLRQ